MFTKSVGWYDAIYSWKEYERETGRLRLLIGPACTASGLPRSWTWRVAPASTSRISKPTYAVEGLDLDDEMLGLARQRHPDVASIKGTCGR